ncbi:hypothetical protein OU416_07895 [Saccharopolyspora indica]|nr:hypothetical protein [Saccharopolyspora indica]MDA3643972.1 hypothetical protein [Saccharopolyspora indica]
MTQIVEVRFGADSSAATTPASPHLGRRRWCRTFAISREIVDTHA